MTAQRRPLDVLAAMSVWLPPGISAFRTVPSVPETPLDALAEDCP